MGIKRTVSIRQIELRSLNHLPERKFGKKSKKLKKPFFLCIFDRILLKNDFAIRLGKICFFWANFWLKLSSRVMTKIPWVTNIQLQNFIFLLYPIVPGSWLVRHNKLCSTWYNKFCSTWCSIPGLRVYMNWMN